MPDMSWRPRGINQSITNNILKTSEKMDQGFEKSVEETSSSWVSHNSKQSIDQNEDADLQRAIELSLQVDSSFSKSGSKKSLEKIEQDDLARALAVSISDLNKNTNKNKSSNVDDHLPEPQKLLRKDKDWPVGLRNVGNTCWFNVVIQSLFHVPSFRSFIFQFTSLPSGLCPISETQRSLCLVNELRCLFSLMFASRRSAIDPSKLVNIIQDSTNRNKHEDASEFIHNLLAQLEEAFRYQAEIKQAGARDNIATDSNPMLKMFYGNYAVVDRHNDEQQHTFSILPLCVRSQLTLHRSLNQATSKTNSNASEIWFRVLPPVLTFQLSRFHFNQDRGLTEKIHDRFSFPSVIYMDRYLEKNKESTRLKREETKKITTELNQYKSLLDRYTNYPVQSSSRFLTLSDALACCAQFASEIEMKEPPCDVNSLSPSRRRNKSGSSSDGLLPCKRSKEGAAELANVKNFGDRNDDEVFCQNNESQRLSFVSNRSSISGDSVESVLRRWKTSVDRDVEELKSKIAVAQHRLERLYEEPHLHNHPYALHAVLVHQGEALAGHYWAYIRDHKKERWLKFNDTSVTEASFEQVNSDSIGGRRSSMGYESDPSAYCLIYTDSKNTSLMSGGGLKEILCDVNLSNLVKSDEERLLDELEKYRLEKESKNNESSSGKKACTAWDFQPMRQAINKVVNIKPKMIIEDAVEQGSLCPVFQSCLLAIINVVDVYNMEGVEAATEQIVRDEYNNLVALKRDGNPLSSDCRLISVVVYMIQNNAPRKLIDRRILEQLTDPRLECESLSRDIMTCAVSMLKKFPLEDNERTQYKKWQDWYATFRMATYQLIEGLKKFQKRLYFDAVCHLVALHEHNKSLEDGVCDDKQVNVKFVSSYRRASIQRIHEEAMKLVEDDKQAVAHSGLVMLRSKLIPCMSVLISPDWGGGSPLDLQLADTIRDQWCSLIEKPSVLPREELSEGLTEFLDANPLSARSIAAPELGTPPTDLCRIYEETMTLLQQSPA